MGMIKLPKNSIDYFKKNLDEIFQSGNLAEGQWNKRLEGFVKDLTGSQVSVATNSNGAGLVALLSIYRYYYHRNIVLIQANTMYGVKTMVLSGGCKLAGFINRDRFPLDGAMEIFSYSVNFDDKTSIFISASSGMIIDLEIF